MPVEPRKGMVFDSEDDAVRFYKGYAKKKGFGVMRRTTRYGEDNMVTYFTLACSRQGKTQCSEKNSFMPNPSTRMQCPAKSNFSRREEKFCITSLTLDHNHPISPSKSRFFRCHKKLDLHSKRRLELNDQAGIRMNKNFGSLVMEAGGYGNLEFGEKECRNAREKKAATWCWRCTCCLSIFSSYAIKRSRLFPCYGCGRGWTSEKCLLGRCKKQGCI